MFLLYLVQTLPGENTVSKALETDPLVLALVTAGIIALAMMVGAVTVLLFVRIVGQRTSGENKTMTTMAVALADALDTRDSQIAKEIHDINERDSERKEAQTSLLVNQAKAMEMVVSKLESLPSILEVLNELVHSVEVLKMGADKDRLTYATLVGQNETLDDVVKNVRDELQSLVALLKEATGNIADIQRVYERIVSVETRIISIDQHVSYLKDKADTQELPKVIIAPLEEAPSQVSQ